MPQQPIGQRIKQARLNLAAALGRDIQIKDVAEAVGITGSAVSQWESGGTTPKLEQIQRLAAYLRVSPAWLAFGDADSGAGNAPSSHDPPSVPTRPQTLRKAAQEPGKKRRAR